jgi:Domain of unknown function (DUF397)
LSETASAASWKTSSRCGSGTCVAVKIDGAAVRVRDTKDSDSAVLTFTPAEWRDFVAGVKLGEFDLGLDGPPSP